MPRLCFCPDPKRNRTPLVGRSNGLPGKRQKVVDWSNRAMLLSAHAFKQTLSKISVIYRIGARRAAVGPRRREIDRLVRMGPIGRNIGPGLFVVLLFRTLT